jgi:phytoene dehydrogenase-like protein
MSDAVVIGSGPNGLVAANILAEHGWSVTVLEARPSPGGGVRSEELIEPGFVNDVCSAFYPLAAASPAIRALRLEDHGLRWLHSPTVLAHPKRDGTCPIIDRDLDTTCAALDRIQPGDGAAWRRLYGRWRSIEDPFLETILRPFPPVRPALRIATSMSPRDLLRLTRFVLLPVRRMGEEEFESDSARLLLAGAALHADFSPESTLSGMFGWLMCGLAQSFGFPVPEGGAGSFAGALVRRLESYGGRVVCDAPVRRIVVRGGRAVAVQLADGEEVPAGDALLADVNAPMLYRDLVGAEHLPTGLMADLERFQWDDATVKVDWNLDGPIPWTAEAARRAGTVHVAEGVDALTLSASELARGLVPSHPFLLMGQQSMTDPSRQPAGTETAWAYTHVPRRIKGDAGATPDSGRAISAEWSDDDAERIADRIEAEVEVLAPGFRSLIRGRHVLTPPRFEQENPNLDSAAINGGTAQLHQQLVFRPVPGLGRAETPVKGLYLASGSAHPGGGVHGAAGANAARAALAAERLRSVTTALRRR